MKKKQQRKRVRFSPNCSYYQRYLFIFLNYQFYPYHFLKTLLVKNVLKIVFNKACCVTNEIKWLLIRHVAVIFLLWPHHVASDRICLRPFIFFMRTTASQHKVRKYSVFISRSYIMSIMSPSLKCVIYAVTFCKNT